MHVWEGVTLEDCEGVTTGAWSASVVSLETVSHVTPGLGGGVTPGECGHVTSGAGSGEEFYSW